MKGILSYYSDYGEVVWFQNHENLSDFVITQPMAFVKSLRTVITHKVKHNFKDVKFKEDMQDLMKRGCLSFKVFSEAYRKQEQDFSDRDAWRFMKELGLAFPFEKDGPENDETVIIPCLIKDDMETKMKEKEREMEESNNAVCLMYEFNRCTSTVWIYYKLLEVFAKRFLGRNMGTFHFAYSQKIEKRRLGTVAGIEGTLKWTNSKTGMQKPDEYSFLLLEYESTVCNVDLEKKPFALNRGIKFHLRPKTGEMTEDVVSILKEVDAALTPHLEEVQRSLACRECLEDGVPGYFRIHEGVKLDSEIQKCSEAQHSLHEKLADSMQKNQKPFEMKNLLAVDKSSLNLEPFGDSRIKREMLSGQLERGEQIWIFHDSQTDSCNPVACVNAYAHVVIYIGKTGDVHEVVHISSAPLTRGLMKAKIRRQDVMEVIKARDHVFLGHQIPDCEVSANFREEIVRRAVKCTVKPSIVFDYHYRYTAVTA